MGGNRVILGNYFSIPCITKELHLKMEQKLGELNNIINTGVSLNDTEVVKVSKELDTIIVDIMRYII